MNTLEQNDPVTWPFHRLYRVLLALGVLLLPVIFIALVASPAHADSSDYVETLEGDMPLVFAVGHGGWKLVGDLKNYGQPWIDDPLLQEYFLQVLAVRIYEQTGHLPYIVYQQGQRCYVNVNREVGNTEAYHPNNQEAKAAYFEFHNQLDDMIARAEAEYGANRVLLINPHTADLNHEVGNRPWDRIADIGFIASVTSLGSSYNTMKALYNRRGPDALRGEDSIPYQLFHAQYWDPQDPPWPPAVTTSSKTLAKDGLDVWHVLPAYVTDWDTNRWVTAYYNGRSVIMYHGTNTSGRHSYWHNGLDAFQMEVNMNRYSGISLNPYDPGYDPNGPYYQLDVTFTTRFMDDLIDSTLYSLEANYDWTPGGAYNVIVDNGDPGFSTTGPWQVSSGEGFWKSRSIWTDQAGATATWAPTLTRTGTYQVLIRWTDAGARTYDAQYTVNHAQGSQVFTIDQTNGQDAKWVSLGYFPFEAGGGGNVVLTSSGTESSTAADAVLFRLDEEPPIPPNLLNPVDGAIINDTTPTLTWRSLSLDVAGYLLDWNGTVSDVGALSQISVGPLADGVYTWTAAAYDAVGNVSDFASVYSLTVDTVPPEPAVLLAPTDGTLISDTTPSLSWAASPNPDTAGYLLSWQDGPIDVGAVTQYSPVITSDGVYSWTVAAYDRAANASPYTDVWSLVVDTTPPTMPPLLAPTDGAIISDTHLSLSWAASPSPDTAGYLLSWQDGPIDVGAVTQYSPVITSDGVYSWTVAAYDRAANAGPYTDTWSFNVDQTPPQPPTLLSPPDGSLFDQSPAPVTLTWDLSPSPDVAGYRLNWEGSVIDVGEATQHPLTLSADGSYTWSVAAYDRLNNTSPYTDAWGLSLDARPPQVQSTSPADQATGVALYAPILITFSEEIVTDSLDYTLYPDPGGWSATWNQAETAVTLEHDPFDYQTVYTASLTEAQDQAGHSLANRPVDWTFSTEATSCVEIAAVHLTRLSTGTVYVNQPVEFSAALSPNDGDPPFGYRWLVDGQASAVENATAKPLWLTHTFTTVGPHTTAVVAWNCQMSPALGLTDSLTVQVQPPPCLGLDEITILGPSHGSPGTYTFSTSYQPITASRPITYRWDNGDDTAQSVRSLDAGTHTLTVTASNCLTNTVQNSHTIVIDQTPVCTQVTSVNLSLPVPGTLYSQYPTHPVADILPVEATPPYSYTVDYGDGSPPVSAANSDNPLPLTHTYTHPSTYTVEIALWNCEMDEPVRDTLTITVDQMAYATYLPILIKSD